MRLSTPWAIIIGALVVSLILVISAKFIGQDIWTILTALGTLGAVIWAIYHQDILERRRRPKLEISLYEPEPPHLRPVSIDIPIRDADMPDQQGVRKVKVFSLTLKLINTGETIAKNAQPLITNVGTFKNGQWQTQDNWLPVPLLWVFDELAQHAAGKPTEEKDLVAERPYLFNMGQLSTENPDIFELLPAIVSKSQTASYKPGEYCFEITAFAVKTDLAKKYIRIQWDGGTTRDYEDVKTKIRVLAENKPPWPT